jgi:outer membrane protein
MKNGWLIWNIVLTLVAGYLLISHFTSHKDPALPVASGPKDSTFIHSPFRVAYFEMDSIAATLYIVRDFKKEMTKKEEENDSQIEALRKKFQQKFYDYQSQAQAGKMNDAQTEDANREMKITDDKIREKKQQLDSDYNEEYVIKENAIKKQIQDFLKKYNNDRTYAYIFANQPGLFYYCDTVYNITGDIIKGMNEQYKNKKQ